MRKASFYKGLLISAIITLLDQLSKWWVFGMLSSSPASKIEVTNFFSLVMVWNKGISFGLFGETGYGHIIFSVIALIIAAFLLHWLWNAQSRLLVIGLGLVIGGAIGNIIDRIRFKAVADFLDFYLGSWHWPAFNVADAAICIGVALLCIDSLLTQNKEQKE